jgi:hypothetical protein
MTRQTVHTMKMLTGDGSNDKQNERQSQSRLEGRVHKTK